MSPHVSLAAFARVPVSDSDIALPIVTGVKPVIVILAIRNMNSNSRKRV